MCTSDMSAQTDFPCDKCENLNDELMNKSKALEGFTKELEIVITGHDDKVAELKTVEAQLKDKDNVLELKTNALLATQIELSRVDKELKDLVTETSKNVDGQATSNDNLTLKRLRKIHADLEKEKKKMEENHIRETDSIIKAKRDIEEELRTMHVNIKDLKQERKTFMNIFNCMTELLDQKNIKFPVPKVVIDLGRQETSSDCSNKTSPPLFVCDSFEYSTAYRELLIKHIDTEHKQEIA